MSAASTTNPPPETASPGALRIVLFGMPAAGKTSLLGALGQAAQTQEHLLSGRLVDLTQGLAELRQRLYEDKPRRTAEEIVPYPVRFEPLTADGQGSSRPPVDEAILIDCDGRVANDLLVRRQALRADSPEGTLAREVLQADALLLVIDASDSETQLDADFAEFRRFLRLFERARGERTEVGGLPVFLVLTKCDLLARPDDKPTEWSERIEERKRQVDRRFKDFLGRDDEEGPVPFGRIDLHVWATAVKRPALAASPGKPREPYGVAELFRHAFDSARHFRQRSRTSTRRLMWTVGGAAGIVAVLTSITIALLSGKQESRPSPLLTKVESYRSREEQTLSTRLAGPVERLERKARELADLRNDPEFGELPAAEQDYVKNRQEELRKYLDLVANLQVIRSIADSRTENDLRALEQAFMAAVRAGDEKEWARTEAVEERDGKLKDIEALRRAVESIEDWFLQKKKDGERLWAFAERRTNGEAAPVAWGQWHEEVRKLFSEVENAPFREAERIPGSRALTYATVLRFDRVAAARNEWQAVRQRLERLRDITSALGLAGEPSDRPAPLRIQEPPRFSVAEARGRLQQVQTAYPRFEKEFVLAGLPDAVTGELRRAARTNYEHAIEAGREVILRQLQRAAGSGGETPEAWRTLLNGYLREPDELSAWRVLAQVLSRLHEPEAADPVAALTSFLAKDRFAIDVKRLTLEIPDDLKVRPAGNLAIFHPATTADGPTLVLEPYGEGRRDAQRRVTQYTFWAKDGKALTYRPGEQLWATLALKDGDNRDWMFTWVRCRSAVYQFERLVREPWLHPKDQEYSTGKLTRNVHLTVREGQGVPAVPDLVPVVVLNSR